MRQLLPAEVLPAKSLIVVDGQQRQEPGLTQQSLLQFRSLLPHLNWRCHIFLVVEQQRQRVACRQLLLLLTEFLSQHSLSTIALHPLLTLDRFDDDDREAWQQIFEQLRPFREEAFLLQGESRLLLLPIIEPLALDSSGLDSSGPDASRPDASSQQRVLDFFQQQLAIPSLYLRQEPAAVPSGVRIYLQSAMGSADPPLAADTFVAQIWHNQIFENLLDRVGDNPDDAAQDDAVDDVGGLTEKLLDPCQSHLIVDFALGGVFSCFSQWQQRQPLADISSCNALPPLLRRERQHGDCSSCFTQACLTVAPGLGCNNKSKEGQQVFFKVALALSQQGHNSSASDLAQLAFDCAQDDQQRAAALLHKGLCLLSLRRHQDADDALALGSRYATDVGLFAYQRGRVQFDWRDYIEALDRFEEALAEASPNVPLDDLYLSMAISHITIEEYPEARVYLDKMVSQQMSSPIVQFYLGVCAHASQQMEQALEFFQCSLRLGPDAEDLSRVLFYSATCLKELERFTEAAEVLHKAIAADPQDPINYSLQGYCYYRLKQHQQAVVCFEKVVQLDPTSAIDWASLGSNLRDLGKIEEAVAMYRKALFLDPSIGFARDNIARLSKVLDAT